MIKLYNNNGAAKAPRLSRAKREEIERSIQLRSKVQRPAIMDLFMSGKFYDLPAVPQSIVKDRATRILEHSDDGWTVPESDLGRGVNTSEMSTAISIKAWIKKHLGDYVDVADISVVVED